MYGPLRPLPYDQMRDRLEVFGIVECGENEDPLGGCCRVFRLMRMGLGTGEYYNFPFEDSDAVIPEPEIAGMLAYFGIEQDEFMDWEHNPSQKPSTWD